MEAATKKFYEKRGQVLVKNLQSRQFDAYYCDSKADALAKALELIPKDSTVGWGGAMSAQQIGLLDAVRSGEYHALDRDTCATMEDRVKMMKKCLTADVFLTGANAISLDGQMVNIDGIGNRVAAIVYGPDSVIVIAGMNKVATDVPEALHRVRNIASPPNTVRLNKNTPCAVDGRCHDCYSPDCICNQVVITRRSRAKDRIIVILVNDNLGF